MFTPSKFLFFIISTDSSVSFCQESWFVRKLSIVPASIWVKVTTLRTPNSLALLKSEASLFPPNTCHSYEFLSIVPPASTGREKYANVVSVLQSILSIFKSDQKGAKPKTSLFALAVNFGLISNWMFLLWETKNRPKKKVAATTMAEIDQRAKICFRRRGSGSDKSIKLGLYQVKTNVSNFCPAVSINMNHRQKPRPCIFLLK